MLAIFSCEEPADSRTWLVWQSCCNRLCSCLPRNHSNILPPLNCICCSGRTDTHSPPPTPTPLDPNPWLQGWSLIVVNKSASLATIKRMSTEEARGIKKKKKKKERAYIPDICQSVDGVFLATVIGSGVDMGLCRSNQNKVLVSGY